MPNPTPGDLHVNVPLTNVSVAYIQNQSNFIADRVFPRVPVQKQSDLFWKYRKGEWRRTDVQVRAPSTETVGTGWNTTTDNYFAHVFGVHKDIDDQLRANADSAFNLDRDATEFVTQQMLLKRDKDFVETYMADSVWATTEDGATLYVGDEVGTSGNWIRIFDARDPDDVEQVGEIVVDPDAIVHNCYVRGDRLYVAHYTEGLRVFDVSAPHAPVEVAYLDTYLDPGYGFNGAWTAYPFLPSGKILVSDLQSGLWVVALEGDAVATAPAPDGPAALRAFPNPTTGAATLAFDLRTPAEVEVVVVDVLGREVARVRADGRAGANRVALALGDVPAGVYVARLLLDGLASGTATLTVAR